MGTRIGIGIEVGMGGVVALDADAQAFITAAGITDPTQVAAVNTLVVSYKSAGLWNRLTAMYPFVGGTASSHKWNLKDPRDLDAAYRLTFSGGITHNANGITGNGVNGYVDTYIPYTAITLNDNSLFLYNRTNAADAGADYGLTTAVGAGWDQYLKNSNTNTYYANGRVDTNCGNVVASPAGSYRNNRTASNNETLFRNGVSLNNNSSASAVITPSGSLVLLARRLNGSVEAGSYSARNIAGFDIGGSLSDAEALTAYNIWQTFQTSLGRNV